MKENMPDSAPLQLELLDDLENRQNDVIRRLDELNRTVEDTLKQLMGQREAADAQAAQNPA